MTEEIIDGVDVSGCEYCIFAGAEFPECRIKLSSFEIKCEGYNCYFKQLKRKEAELKELQDYIKEDLIPHTQIYIKALEEIREIASFKCKACDKKCNSCEKFIEIQTKISEVLGDEQ